MQILDLFLLKIILFIPSNNVTYEVISSLEIQTFDNHKVDKGTIYSHATLFTNSYQHFQRWYEYLTYFFSTGYSTLHNRSGSLSGRTAFSSEILLPQEGALHLHPLY